MTYQGFKEALRKQCNQKGIRFDQLNIEKLYKEFEKNENWKDVNRMLNKNIRKIA